MTVIWYISRDGVGGHAYDPFRRYGFMIPRALRKVLMYVHYRLAIVPSLSCAEETKPMKIFDSLRCVHVRISALFGHNVLAAEAELLIALLFLPRKCNEELDCSDS